MVSGGQPSPSRSRYFPIMRMPIRLPLDPPALVGSGHPLATWRLSILLALAYILLGAPGFLLGSPAPVFPAAGLALAALLWFGNRALPGLWLGAVALNLGLHWFVAPWLGAGSFLTPVAIAASIASGATLQAWVGVWLVRHWQGGSWRTLALEQDVLRFLLFGGVLAGVVSTTIGTGTLTAAGLIGATEFAYTWWTWYVGDVIGILVIAPLTLALLDRQDPLWRERRRRLPLPILIIMALAVMAFHGSGQREIHDLQAHLRQVGEAITRDLDNRLHTHHEVLSALRHFIEAKPELNFAEFERFTRASLADNPDLLALNFNPLVSGAERDAFEARMSRQVPTGSFRILERDSERRPIPAGSRSEYVPVTYIVPWERNQAVSGYDNLSEPVRRAATERVRASRHLAVAAPIVLVQEEVRGIGMLEMLPVEDLKATDADGRPRLLGFVVGVVRIDQLIALATQGKIPDGLRLRVTESSVQTADTSQPLGSLARETVLYPADEDPGPRARRDDGNHWQGQLRVGDQDWALILSATPAYLQQNRSWAAWGVGMVGLLFAALLQILLLGFTGRTHLSQRQNAALEAEITERKLAEQALRASEQRYRELSAELEGKVEERTAALRDANVELNRLATTDSLTGAWNRRYFEQAAAFEIARYDRYGEPALALLLFDIDHFKRINDQHGHPVGDKVLVELTQRVRHRLRATDILARWGGEEFVVLLPHCDTDQAVTLAEKLRHLIAAEPFPAAGSLTASFGVAAYRAEETLATWIKRVDEALYAAKGGGRDQVRVAG